MNDIPRYTLGEIQGILANLENGIPGPDKRMSRVKLPIPEEYGGGWATGKFMEDAVQNLIERIKPVIFNHKESISFKDCGNRWLDMKNGENRSPNTIANYTRLLETKIFPFFSSKSIGAIKAEDIQLYFNSIMKQSRSTSIQSKAILSGIFEFAERNDLIDRNPMRFKYNMSTKVGKKVVLQDKDLVDVISQLDILSGNDYLYACFLCFTALRRGEILGLKWSDIDFENCEIHVQRGVSFPNGSNDPVIDRPKDDSRGIVHLNSELAERIKPHKTATDTYILPYNKDHLNWPITRSMFTKMWQRITKTIDLKGATSHSFRATYATMMNAHCNHIDPKALQGALRHKTPDLAIKVYTKENVDKTRLAEMEYDEWIQSQLKQTS